MFDNNVVCFYTEMKSGYKFLIHYLDVLLCTLGQYTHIESNALSSMIDAVDPVADDFRAELFVARFE